MVQYCSHAEYCHQAKPAIDTSVQIPRYKTRPIVFSISRPLNGYTAFNASQAKKPVHIRALLRTVPARDQIIAGTRRYPLWKKKKPQNERKQNNDSVFPASRNTPDGENECRMHVTVPSDGHRGNSRLLR